jgi:hypothetical protein
LTPWAINKGDILWRRFHDWKRPNEKTVVRKAWVGYEDFKGRGTTGKHHIKSSPKIMSWRVNMTGESKRSKKISKR